MRIGAAVVQNLSARGEAMRKDGRRLWMDVRGTALRDERDTVLYLLTDSTVAKESEENRVRAAALEAENRRLAEVGRVKGAFL